MTSLGIAESGAKISKSEKTSMLYDGVIKGIKELGFPVVLSIFLLYNQWTMQNFLVEVVQKRDAQIGELAKQIQLTAEMLNRGIERGRDTNQMVRDIWADDYAKRRKNNKFKESEEEK